MARKNSTKNIKARSATLLSAKSRNSAGFMKDRRKKRIKENINWLHDW